MYRVLEDKLLRIQEAMEQELRSITLDDMDSDLRRCLFWELVFADRPVRKLFQSLCF